STAAGDKVEIRRLPEIEINSVERPAWSGSPLWLSWDASSAWLSRSEPATAPAALKTPLIERFDFYPRITLPLQWSAFRLTTTAAYLARHYGGERVSAGFSNRALNRSV